MQLEFTRASAKALRKLQPKVRDAMIDRLKAIAADPFAKHANVDALVGEKDAFRFRLGGWRAVYRVDRESGVVLVLRIEPRGEVYR
ncbi:MAG TPA: type II toxin-antitoxin system RelE/ParE family toxin [Methyloceanibacter sp.]|nr:type II toxin-antitoxin system RelE/ParE family toxin [Methyloceanibacter sp.]